MRSTLIHATLASLMIGAACVAGRLSAAYADPTTQPAATQPTTAAAVINWDEASKHVGETVTITGPVIGTHVTSGGRSLVLNIGKDFPDPSRFSIMIKTDDKSAITEETYKGKTVTVTGKVELYRKVAEIRATAAEVTVATPQ